jgi:sugar phosphate permease
VPPTVRLTADVFGPQRAGIVFGWIFAAHQLGAAVAASAAGLIRTELGDYLPAFIAAGSIGIVAGVMSLFIGRKPAAQVPAPVAAESAA